MKIIIAPDSFKDSISAQTAANAIAKGLTDGMGDHVEILCKPIADGGEGTLDAMIPSDAQLRKNVTGPLQTPVNAAYGCVGDTAIVEMASAAGLMLIPSDQRSAGRTTTYGVGELLLDAIRCGYRRIMLTVGGSATNDGGCGMLSALGAVFRNRVGEVFLPTGLTLSSIASMDLTELQKNINGVEFILATDVKNPLLGEKGATLVYGRQKGATDEELLQMERGMRHYAELLQAYGGKDVSAMQGCGAGGGLGAPLLAFANASVRSGIDTVLSVLQFEKALADADLVITGEGKMDVQSLYGKAVSGVAKRAVEQGIPVYAFVGCLGSDKQELLSMGLADVFEVRSLATSDEDSMKNAADYLRELAKRLAIDLMR